MTAGPVVSGKLTAQHYSTESQDVGRPRRLTATLVVGAFLLAALVGIHQVSPGVVFAKLQSDSAVYLAQAKHLWREGSIWNFSLGDGLAPFLYSPVSSILRAPLFGMTDDAATLVRLIQYENVALLLLLALVSRKFLTQRLAPELQAWSYIPFAYLLTTYDPWVLNTLLPFGDHVYALLTVGAMVMALRSEAPASTGAACWGRRLATLALSAVATLQKFTSATLLVYIARVWGRNGRARSWIMAAAVVEIGTIVASRKLFGSYVQTGVSYYFTGRSAPAIILDSTVNLLVAAIPNQVLPNFSYLMSRDFTATHAVTASALTWQNLPWMLFGLALSGLVVHGAWRERRRLQPELLLLLICVTVYAAATNSTSRYLASIQPIFWLFFLSGMQSLLVALRGRWRVILPVGSLVALTYCAVVTVNISRSFTARSNARPAMLPNFMHSLSESFEALQGKLAQMVRQEPAMTFVLMGDEIRWYALADAKFIAPSVAERHLCSGQKLLAVFACDARNCPRLERDYREVQDRDLSRNVELQTLYHAETPAARIVLSQLHLRNTQACGGN